jgi:NAD-dependent deacetylase
MMNFDPAVLQIIRDAERLVALTGAGVSKESGIPTFREAQTGLWAQYDPTELATPQAFQRDPKLVWEWYQWRRSLFAEAHPNPGHTALAAMEAHARSLVLITQNIDGFHQQAGSRNVIELHGSIQRNKCFKENTIIHNWVEDGNIPPRCPNCGSPLRPDVVWFGENLPPRAIQAAVQAAQEADVFLSIGTSAVVEPAASLPLIARQAGAVLVEINPDRTPVTAHADYVLQGPSGVILPELVAQTWNKEGET